MVCSIAAIRIRNRTISTPWISEGRPASPRSSAGIGNEHSVTQPHQANPARSQGVRSQAHSRVITQRARKQTSATAIAPSAMPCACSSRSGVSRMAPSATRSSVRNIRAVSPVRTAVTIGRYVVRLRSLAAHAASPGPSNPRSRSITARTASSETRATPSSGPPVATAPARSARCDAVEESRRTGRRRGCRRRQPCSSLQCHSRHRTPPRSTAQRPLPCASRAPVPQAQHRPPAECISAAASSLRRFRRPAQGLANRHRSAPVQGLRSAARPIVASVRSCRCPAPPAVGSPDPIVAVRLPVQPV